jgi:hypothetical protein
MSDVNITFPVWVAPLLIGALYWPAFLFGAVVFAALGAFTHRRLSTAMFVLGGVSALLALCAPAMTAIDVIQRRHSHAIWARTHETISTPLDLRGLTIPAGTQVTWADDAHSAVTALMLPGPTHLLGVILSGQLENVYGQWWAGRLDEPAGIDGWPCAADDVWLSHDAHLMRCVLAADRADRGLTIPTGSEVVVVASHHVGEVRLASDRTMALPSIGAVLPVGGSLFFDHRGLIERAYVPAGTTMRVGDVELRYDIHWIYPPSTTDRRTLAVALRGEIAVAATLGDAPMEVGTMTVVDLGSRTAHGAPAR